MANDLLIRLVDANLAAAGAIVAVLALRGAVRALLGARTAYALWLIAPSAMLASFIPARVVPVAAAALDPVAVAIDPAPIGTALRLAAQTTVAAGPDLPRILIGVWLAGVAVSLWLLLIGHRRALAQFGRISVDPTDPRVGRASKTGVGPALLGIVRPRVIVPADFEVRFNAGERAMILTHERTHLSAGHALLNALTALMRAVNWFNPLIHVAARCMRIDQELACDAAVIERFPRERQTYASALLKTQLAFTSSPLGCDWPVRSPNLLEERIKMLALQSPGRSRLFAGAAVVTALTLAAGFATWAAEPPATRIAPEATRAPTPAQSPLVVALAAPAKPATASQAPPATGAVAAGGAAGLSKDRQALVMDQIRQAIARGASAHDVAVMLHDSGQDIEPSTAAWVRTPEGRFGLGYATSLPQRFHQMRIFGDGVPPNIRVENLPTLDDVLGPAPPQPPPSPTMTAVSQKILSGGAAQDAVAALLAAGEFGPPSGSNAPPLPQFDTSTARFVRLPGAPNVGLGVALPGKGVFVRAIPGTQSYPGLAVLPTPAEAFPPPTPHTPQS